MNRINKDRLKEFFNDEKVRIIILIVIATLIRIYKLSNEVFKLDESGYVISAFWNGLKDIITQSHAWDHPPFYFVIYNLWTKIFGISEYAITALSIIFGVASLVVMYFIVKKLFRNKDIAFFSTLLASFSLFHFHYSRHATEISFYGLIIFLSIYAFLFFLDIKSSTDRKKITLICAFYIISTVLMFYTHNYAFTIIIALNVAFFLFWKRHKKLVKTWITINIIILLLIIPELGQTYRSARVYGMGLKEMTTGDAYLRNIYMQSSEIYDMNTGNIDDAIEHAFNKEIRPSNLVIVVWWGLCFLIILGILLPLFKTRRKRKNIKIKINKKNFFHIVLLLILFFIPILITAFYPIVFRAKCFIYTVLIYNVFITLGIWYLFNKKNIRPARIIAVVLIIILGLMSINRSLNLNSFFYEPYEDWKGTAEFLKKQENQADTIVVHVLFTYGALLYYYDKDLFSIFAVENKIPIDADKSNLITIEYQGIENPEVGDIALPLDEGLIRFNYSLQNINDFWLVSNGNENAVYPDREVFNLIEQNFNNVSEHYFGSVYVTRYNRK